MQCGTILDSTPDKVLVGRLQQVIETECCTVHHTVLNVLCEVGILP